MLPKILIFLLVWAFHIIMLIGQQNYFSDLYPAKILDLSANPFFPCVYKTFLTSIDNWALSAYLFSNYKFKIILYDDIIKILRNLYTDILKVPFWNFYKEYVKTSLLS